MRLYVQTFLMVFAVGSIAGNCLGDPTPLVLSDQDVQQIRSQGRLHHSSTTPACREVPVPQAPIVSAPVQPPLAAPVDSFVTDQPPLSPADPFETATPPVPQATAVSHESVQAQVSPAPIRRYFNGVSGHRTIPVTRTVIDDAFPTYDMGSAKPGINYEGSVRTGTVRPWQSPNPAPANSLDDQFWYAIQVDSKLQPDDDADNEDQRQSDTIKQLITEGFWFAVNPPPATMPSLASTQISP